MKSKNIEKSKLLLKKCNTGDLTIYDYADNDKKHSKVKKCCNNSQKERKIDADKDKDNKYPIDIWFMIGEHISPDQVGVFALICTDTYLVTRSAQFWLNLYKRYTIPSCLVPSCLQHYNTKDKCGFRAHVIRGLHYSYFQQVKKKACDTLDIKLLKNSQCVAMWRDNNKQQEFYFKFQKCNMSKNNLILERLKIDYNRQNVKFQNNIHYNIENCCKVLKVVCLTEYFIPNMEGLILQNICYSPYDIDCNLTLDFCHYLKPLTTYTLQTQIHKIYFKRVRSVELMDWWETKYPYQEVNWQYKIKLPPTIDSWELI